MAAVRFDDRIADRQPQTRALARLFRGEERREQLRRHRVGDAGAGVGEPQMHLAVEPGADRDAPRPLRRVAGDGVRGVREQVEDDLLERVAIAEDVGEEAGEVLLRLDVLELQVVAHE